MAEKKNTIGRLLLPVRMRMVQLVDGSLANCIICNNGEQLTDNIPYDWAQFICTTLNEKYYKKNNSVGRLLAVMRIPGNPIQMSESQRVVEKNGTFSIVQNPDYYQSFERIAQIGEDLFINRWTQLPIQIPIEVSAFYNVHSKTQFSLPSVNEWLLDLLKTIGIIQSTKAFQVKSMDGSYIKHTAKPEIIVTIREGGK